MESEIREILAQHSGIPNARDISVEDNLWALGMTSLNSVQVMVALEGLFGFRIPEEQLKHETFASIENIAACVKSLTK
jgi:acyl carrier protein